MLGQLDELLVADAASAPIVILRHLRRRKVKVLLDTLFLFGLQDLLPPFGNPLLLCLPQTLDELFPVHVYIHQIHDVVCIRYKELKHKSVKVELQGASSDR